MNAPTTEQPRPVALKNEGEALRIEWSDGVVHRLKWTFLRKMCPCATCRTEQEKPPAPPSQLPVLSPEEARPLKPTGMHAVGNYAYNIQFSDGHHTGIYTLEYLRRLGEDVAESD